MIYSDTTNKQGIVQDVDFLVDTDSNTYSIEDKTRNANRAIDYVSAIIIGSDSTWQWDDTNYTDLPIGVTNLTSTQQDYTFDDTHLYCEAVEIKTPSGDWIKLLPIDLYTKETEQSISDFDDTPGIPRYYDKVGQSIFLYPTPNYTQTGGLKCFFQRLGVYFDISDTTKKPGFASHLHRYISISVAYDWAVACSHPKLNWLANEKLKYEQQIIKFYSKRIKDERPRLVVGSQNNR